VLQAAQWQYGNGDSPAEALCVTRRGNWVGAIYYFSSSSLIAVACAVVNSNVPLSVRSNSCFRHLDRMRSIRECPVECNKRCPSSWAMAWPKMIPAGTPLLLAIVLDLSQRTTAWLPRTNGKANPSEASVAMPGLLIDAVLTTMSQSWRPVASSHALLIRASRSERAQLSQRISMPACLKICPPPSSLVLGPLSERLRDYKS
jgi:hypothetical protein